MLELCRRPAGAGARSRPVLSMIPSPSAAVLAIRAVAGMAVAVAMAFMAVMPAAAATFDPAALPAARALAPNAPIQLVKAPDLASDAELVRFEAELLPALLRVRPGERVRIAAWPVAPGARQDVLITRHEIYAPGARVLRVDAGGTREVPRSRLVFFWGTHASDRESGIFISVDPVTGTFESVTQSKAGQYQLRPLVAGKAGLHLVATAEAFLAGSTMGKRPSWHCAEESLIPLPVLPAAGRDSQAGRVPRDPGAVTASGGFDLATIAIDTDHQFMANKFNNDTIQATNYIASLFAAVNVMYERDVQVELLEGNTNLRTSAAGDPYTVNPNGNANGPQLTEFESYWSANYVSVNRTVAALLSGKQPTSNSASGIAERAALCDTSRGYSVNQVFQIDYLLGDSQIFGHELGHNFGSEHTHCYNPPIDHCFNQEGGSCYSGPTTSCPAPTTINGVTGVTGTMMSYCNFLGPTCDVFLVFHPRVVAVLQSNVAGALGVCMTSGTSASPSVSGISPDNGPAAGGTAVVISGSNFQSGDTVTIGGVAATGVNVTGPGTITAVTGAHPTGLVDVVVNGGGGAGTLARSFFYSPPPNATSFFTVSPCRVVDTRNASGPLGGPAMTAGQTRSFKITGSCAIPSSAVAVSANVTVIGSGNGFLSLFPGNALPLGTSTVNFGAGKTRANNAIVMLATDGTGTVGVQNSSNSANQLIFDVNGYFQ